MTIGWGTIGTIWGPPKRGKQILEVFLRENRKTADVLLGSKPLGGVRQRRPAAIMKGPVGS